MIHRTVALTQSVQKSTSAQTSILILGALLVSIGPGCAGEQWFRAKNPLAAAVQLETSQTAKADPSPEHNVRAVSFVQDVEGNDDESISSIDDEEISTTPAEGKETPSVFLTPIDQSGRWDISELEAMALANHPTITEAESQIEQLRGKLVQVGLRPNPEFGYFGETGDSGTAGQQGIYLNREFVRGGKLEKNRAIVCAEIEAAEQALEARRFRVLTDIRTLYYRLLVTQRRLEIAKEYRALTDKAVEVSNKLFDAGEVAQIAVLQTKLQTQNAETLVRQTEAERLGIAREINAQLGEHYDANQIWVTGNVEAIDIRDRVDSLPVEIMTQSPELAKAYAELQREQENLTRQCAEQTPNYFLQSSVRHNFSNHDELVGIQLGRPIQTNNWNQGNIRAARAAIVAASQNIERVQRDLNRRSAAATRDLLSADARLRQIREEVIPTAKEVFEIAEGGFQQGEIAYLDLITAQKSLLQANLDYVSALGDFWDSYTLLDGLLLNNNFSN
ncbi:MAG: TolC family protein [Pirellulaceae bacterium]